MKLKRLVAYCSTLLLSMTSLLAFAQVAHAATVTWTGGGADGNWSTPGNWSGSTVPANGDDVVIDNAANFANGSTNNIPSLSLASLTFTNNVSGGGGVSIDVDDLTITGPISQSISVTNTSNDIDGSLTLGGDVTVTSRTGIDIGISGDTITLGGHTLLFTDSGGTTAHNVSIRSVITGSGTVTFNGTASFYILSGNNTYSGTTNLTNCNLMIGGDIDENAFGTSTINIGTGCGAEFNYSANTTISNPIVISGTTGGSPVVSLRFLTTGSGITFTVPNITLNGDTRFSNLDDQLTINLAGITANGHCVQYLGNGTTNDGFTNGPAACLVDGDTDPDASAPGTPDTGSTLSKSNPMIVLFGAIGITTGLILLSRQMKKSSLSNRK